MCKIQQNIWVISCCFVFANCGFLIPPKNAVGLWPYGKVLYTLDNIFTPAEKTQLQLAIDEFHKKTCVKFELWNGNQTNDYVSIFKVNKINCEYTHKCYQGDGRQLVLISAPCSVKDVFVRGLGHSLCLSNENYRPDRNEYLSFEGCNNLPGRNRTGLFGAIYDYASQMHSECGTCIGGTPPLPMPPVCGSKAHSGLSVMDADTLNHLYKCRACHRHRWISINSLNDKHKDRMYSFGRVDYQGNDIFVCRAFYLGEVAVGMYNHVTESCLIPSLRANGSVVVKDKVEIFTIPGGFSENKDCLEESKIGKVNGATSQYQLWSNLLLGKLSEAVPSASIIVGANEYFEGYIAFGSVSSRYFGGVGAGVDADEYFVDVIGTAWNRDGKLGAAYFPVAIGTVVKLSSFKVLVCK